MVCSPASGMIRATIFDMDGLLVDSEPLWMQAEIEVFSAVGVPLTAELCPETRGFRLNELVEYWHSKFPFSETSLEVVAERLMGRVSGLIAEKARALPGALQAVDLARKHSQKLGLASSSPEPIIASVLGALDIRHHFDVVHSADAEPLGKPHPGIYLTTAQLLGVSPLECLALEDSLNGVLAAKSARMKCIAVPEPNQRTDPRFTIADKILDSLVSLDESAWHEPR